jgi:hypothetical protein
MAEWASVVQTAIGPVIGAAISFFALRQSDRERLGAAIIWAEPHDPRNGIEWPFLFIQNRSKQAILIGSVETELGLVFRRRAKDFCPLEFDDPTDLRFPYKIDPGEGWRFALDPKALRHAADTAPALARWLGVLRVPYLRIQARTVGGASISVDGAEGTPWRDRPRWLMR